MQNAFDRLIRRLVMSEGRMSELEDVSMETFKTEKQEDQRLQKKKVPK
jgi:hypothetical protein